jgi:hypothetical protein
MQADKKMPRRATVARHMRDIFRLNPTRRKKEVKRKRQEGARSPKNRLAQEKCRQKKLHQGHD